MHYFIIGADSRLKEEQIASLKEKFLPSPDSKKFDCDILYSHKLTAEDLKKALFALPVFSKERLVILRNGEKLQQAHKELIKDFFESAQADTVLILEAEWDIKEKFVQDMKKYVSVKDCPLPERETIFAVTRMLAAHRQAEAVRLLNDVLEEGTHPLQIMGGLVWFWGNKARAMVDQPHFEKGLLFLQEADLNIKRSKLPPEYALEVLLSKMSVLLNAR